MKLIIIYGLGWGELLHDFIDIWWFPAAKKYLSWSRKSVKGVYSFVLASIQNKLSSGTSSLPFPPIAFHPSAIRLILSPCCVPVQTDDVKILQIGE